MQDLWADFTGDALSMEERSRGGGRRQRRLTEQAMLTDLRVWLLQEYLLPYASSLSATRIFQRCYWIDGLSNSTFTMNKRRNTRHRPKMSTAALPLALQPVATIAQQLARLERPMTLQSFLLDTQNSTRQTRDIAAQSADCDVQAGPEIPPEGGLLAATWAEIAPALLATLGQSAAVFLLDPLKDGLLRHADLAPLYQRTAPTELFLWFSHKHMETRVLPSLRTKEGAATLTNLLRGDHWKSLLTKERDQAQPQTLINELIRLCAESMQPHFLSVQRLAFPVRNGPAHVAHAPYTLLFATRRQDSLACLNDACCQRTRRLIAESQQGILSEHWFAKQRAERLARAWEALVQEALTLGRTQRLRQWSDLRQQLLLAHFGQHTLSEYDQIITTLLARGDVRCEWQARSQPTPGALLPGPGDRLLWR